MGHVILIRLESSTRYRLSRLIKRSRAGELFEAFVRDDEGRARRIAIKRMLPEHAADEELIERFAAEARLISRMHHENLVTVFDFGVMDGRPFQALELVDGFDLESLAASAASRGHIIPADVALHITAEIARALDYAHRVAAPNGEPIGIVHGDVRPESILVSWTGDVKLADFGFLGAEEHARRAFDHAEGRLRYAAPEVQRGDRCDARADIFSLGCVLHWLVAGESPIEDEDMRQAVFAGGRLRIDERLPDAVREIIGCAIEPERHARYATAEEMATDCTHAIGDRGSSAGRAALRRFLEELAAADPTSDRSADQHPLEVLMNLDLVLEDASRDLRRFVSRISTGHDIEVTDEGDTTAPAKGSAADVSQEDLAVAAPEPLLGTVAGEYRLLSVLGVGGFSTVFRGRHLVSGHELAIKVLKIGAPPEFAIRFQREADALAKIDHPNLVDIEGTGALEDGRSYIVMELVPGRTLREVLKANGPFSLSRARSLGRQIASGLAAAHALGFVHRDLKPTNVMLYGEHGAEVVKIVDFGVALLTREEQTRLTRAGRMVGTPRWMSPEQLRADPDIDARADIYTLGALMYAMLMGHAPFRGSLRDVVEDHLYGAPPPLPDGSPFEELIAQCLEKDPAKRPESAAKVIEALDAMELPTELRTEVVSRTGERASDETNVVDRTAGARAAGSVSGPAEDKTAPLVPRYRVHRAPPQSPEAPPPNTAMKVLRKRPEIAIRVEGPSRTRMIVALAALMIALAALAMLQLFRSKKTDPAPAPALAGAEPAPTPLAIPKAGAVRAAPAAEEVIEPERNERPEETSRPVDPKPPEPVRTTGPRPSSAVKSDSRSMGAIQAALSSVLEEHALSFAELSETATTRDAARAFTSARERGDETAARRAFDQLDRAIRALPPDSALVQRKLKRAHDRLKLSALSIEATELASLEKRYLDLRSAIAPSLSPADCRALIDRIAALDRDIRAAAADR